MSSLKEICLELTPTKNGKANEYFVAAKFQINFKYKEFP